MEENRPFLDVSISRRMAAGRERRRPVRKSMGNRKWKGEYSDTRWLGGVLWKAYVKPIVPKIY